MKLCVDCHNMIHGWGCRLFPEYHGNVVNGGFVTYKDCDEIREPEGPCGPEGKLWVRAGMLRRWMNRGMQP
jgi:hypothetical protein